MVSNIKFILGDLLVIGAILIRVTNSTTLNYEEFCPEGYTRIAGHQICVLITTKPSRYTSECLKSGYTSTLYYAQLIAGNGHAVLNHGDVKKLKEVWLPIKRNSNNVFAWDLPGPLYQNGKVAEINSLNTPTNYADGNCIIYDTNLQILRLENCNSSYNLMCLLDMSESVLLPFPSCEIGFVGRLSKYHDFCFHINYYGDGHPIKIDSSDAFAVVDQLIGRLNMKNVKLLVYDSSSSTPDSSAFENGTIKTVDKRSVTQQVVLKARNIDKTPSIDINFNTTINRLLIIVTNYESLWNPTYPEVPFWCYNEIDISDDPQIKLRYNLIYNSTTSKGFETHLSMEDAGISTIWCEGQKLKTFETIRSNRLIVERNMDEYISVIRATLELDCDPVPCNIFNEFEHYRHTAIDIISMYSEFRINHIQIKKVISVGENITFLLHFVALFYNKDAGNRLSSFQMEFEDNAQLSKLRLCNTCDPTNDFFPLAKLNEVVLPKKLCYYSNGDLPVQECVGNLIEGARWKEIVAKNIFMECIQATETVTKNLFNISRRLEQLQTTTLSEENITELVQTAMEYMNETLLKADDIQDMRLVEKTLYNFGTVTQTNIFDLKFDVKGPDHFQQPGAIINPITNMIDSILQVETDSLIDPNNKMLDTIEMLTTQFAESDASESREVLDDHGVRIIKTNSFIVVVVNPLVKNITGIELHRNIPSPHDFLDFSINPLDINHRVQDTKTETLELMAHISSAAFEKIKITQNNRLVPPNRLIFKIYYRTSLFDEIKSDDVHITPDSKVIGISIPNFVRREYPDGIITMFKTISSKTSKNSTRGCSENSIKSLHTKGWDTNLWGRKKTNKGVVLCRVRRPANIGFAKLVGMRLGDYENESPPDVPNVTEIILTYTTFVGCSLSIIGLALIFLTAICNPAWHQNEATPLLMNVSLASVFLIVMFFIIELFGKPEYEDYCKLLGGLIHYAVLVGFFVSVFVTNCQYYRYIVIIGDAVPKHINIKIFIFGWLVPSFIVTICFAFASESYITRDPYYTEDVTDYVADYVAYIGCFPTKLPLYVGLHTPIILIFCYNLSVYVWIIRRVREETPGLRKTPTNTTVYKQIRLFLYLFFILSITWIFALLYHYTGVFAFALLFNVTGTMQGFCLFIFCVFIHDQTRRFWCRKIKCNA